MIFRCSVLRRIVGEPIRPLPPGQGRGFFRRRRSGRSILVLLAVVGVLSACTEEFATPVGSPALLDTGADAVFIGLEHFITLDGVREGKLFADTALLYNDSSLYVLTNPILVLFTETGVQRARVTAQRGRMKTTSQEMVAQGNVILDITEGNKRVESAELHYDPNGDRIWSDSLTTMYEAGTTIRGIGFRSDLEFRQVRVGAGSIRSGGGGGG
jgi:LPS export ABC transporter protein LptC